MKKPQDIPSKIKMVDLYNQYQRLKDPINASIQSVLNETNFINGSPVSVFQNDLSTYLETDFVVTCGNGTDALQIAFMALDLAKGDEVIVPSFTYIATCEALVLLGLTPVFADVEPDTFNINADQLEQLITAKTKAILPVHLYGQCSNMELVLEFANKHHLWVIEDTAQALGANFIFSDGTSKKAGTIGDIGTTSFFPSKNLGCFGDGGAIFTSDKNLAEKCRLIANHGQKVKYHHDVIGCNSRLDTIQAAVLLEKLPHLDHFLEKRRDVAEKYDKHLGTLSGVKCPSRVTYSSHTFHQYTVKLEKDRDVVKSKLMELGIPSMIYYPLPTHQQKPYKSFSKSARLPVSEDLCSQVLSLPMHTEMDSYQLEYIIDGLHKVIKSLP